jgi:hypothetical protein
VLSTIWTDLDAAPTTPFPVGIHHTLLDMECRLRSGRLQPSA